MPTIEDGRIRFSKQEAEKLGGLCINCPFNADCLYDDKNRVSIIIEGMGRRFTDEQIEKEASCLKKK